MTAHGIATQAQLAAELGLGRATVVRAMSRRTAPGEALMAGLSIRLGMRLDELAEVVPPARRQAAA